MKRPTRVPASSTVRMNSASNMIAKWYQMPSRRSPPIVPEKMCAMPTASEGAPPRAAPQRLLADAAGERRHAGRVDGEAPARDGRRGLRGRRPDDARVRVHREVDAGVERAGRDHRHHADERLHQHRAVADEARVALAHQQLGRRARGDQGVEAGDGAAGDRDEAEREDGPGEHRPAAVDEARERRHLDRRAHEAGCRPPERARRRP